MVENDLTPILEEEAPKSRKKKGLAVRSGGKSDMRQRAALHQLLVRDEEYTALGDYLSISPDITDNIDEDVRAETQISSTKNVMQLVFYDIQGYSAELVATTLGMSKSTVLKIRQSDAYKNARTAVTSEIVKHARGIMEVSAIQAVKTLTDCLASNNEKIKLGAASEILNRIGLTATQKVEVTATSNNMVNLSDEQLAEILKTSNLIESSAEVVPNGETAEQ